MHGLFLFRRDLRLDDNSGLLEALDACERVSTAFVLDPRQADSTANPYFSANAFAFMAESLVELSREIAQRGGRLAILRGEAHSVVADLIDREGVEAVFVNRDCTPFALERDARIRAVCEARGVGFHATHDVMLNPPDAVLTNGRGYRVFTPYHRVARERPVDVPEENARTNYGKLAVGDAAEAIETPAGSPQRTIVGGRTRALKGLDGIQRFSTYRDQRNDPSTRGTTRLSAHLKFGTISPREVRHVLALAFGPGSELERQLFWRDFYLQLLYHHPDNLGRNFDPAYANGIAWSEPGEAFARWQAGTTGFPIVDAGMRELSETGWMHNRARLIVASFLTKDLHIDWREGERWFARRLVDYDPANNNGGWQWAASTGADAAPYFRIFNPWRQQQRFDPDAAYVKDWVPELRGLDASTIHGLAARRPDDLDYPEAIVDHRVEREEALRRYKDARSR